MSTINHIRQHLTNKTVVHLAMAAFAITSTLNVAGFFVATHHHVIIAGSIGLALGAGLMAVSIYLSNQDMSNRISFGLMAFASVCMALLSGQIQSMGYQLHGLDPFTARLLGFAPPFVIEILLALSVSLAERNERERVRRDSKAHIKDSVATAMTDAFRSVDTARIQRHIDRQVDSVVKAFVDDALGEMLAELRPSTGKQTTTETEESQQIAASDRPSIADMNAERQRQIEERQQAIINLLAAYGPMSTSELATKLEEDRGIKASDRTIRSDCGTLEGAGDIVKDGRKWSMVQRITEKLPTIRQPALNGTTH